MPDPWVNAVLTITVPLEDVGPDDPPHEITGAVALALADLMDALGAPWANAVGAGAYVIVSEQEVEG